MVSFGQKLREAREEKGLRLEDVSRTTRVRIRYIEALEHDDFDAMPQDVFVRGFVRMYADCLQLDPDPLIADYRRERNLQRPTWEEDARNEVDQEMSRILELPRQASPENSGRILRFAGFAVVLLVRAGAWWSGVGNRDQTRLARAALEAGTPAPVEAVQLPPPPPPRKTPVRRPAARPKPQASPASAPPVEAVAKRPEPEPTAGRLRITECGVGTGVENRRLVGEGDRFAEGTPVWFWTRVLGGTSGETIRHVWKHEGHASTWVPLTLGADHWRTQSRKVLGPGSAGRWAVEALDGAGRVLARREFVCVPEAPSRPF